MITVNCIGAGRVGKALLKLWHDHGLATVGGIVNRSLESAQQAAEFVGGGRACLTLGDLPPAPLILVTTTDAEIPKVSAQLTAVCTAGTILVHCSGALGSDVFAELQARGCTAATAHPVKSFADPATAIVSFPGTLCAVEGDPQATALISSLLERCGARVFSILQEHKVRYHIALVLANNYLTTLHFQATQLLRNSGIKDETAHELVTMLMQDSLRNLNALPHAQALTGPLQRGDVATVKKHLDALSGDNVIQSIYRALGQATLPLLPETTVPTWENSCLFRRQMFT